MKHRLRGFSLIESLLVLSLIALSVLIAIPTFSDQIATTRKSTAIRQMMALLSYSRNEAVSKGHTTTFCPSEDGIACSHGTTNWLLVFFDRNNNQLAEPSELLRSEKPDASDIQYNLVVSAHRNHLRFRPEGTAKEPGSITLCPANHDKHHAAQLIINFGGRIRISPDTNKDGIPEDADGTPVECPTSAG